MEPRLFDAHCHLDLMAYPDTVASEAAAMGLGLFDCGVDPRDFPAAKKRASRYPNIIAGAGLHPWWIADGRCGTAEIDLLCDLAAQKRFIGEVGLDFSARFAGTEEMQTQALTLLCRTLSQRPLAGRVLSIHAVRSAGAVLDILDSNRLLANKADSPAIIFHWFSGTSAELTRARNAGCYFSVNERMLATKRGREYARQIPIDHLLLETDAPAEPQADANAPMLTTSLTNTARSVSVLKNCDTGRIEAAILENSRTIFDFR